MTNKLFKPEEYSGMIIARFASCPGILALFRHGSTKGYSEIYCDDYQGKRMIFFIPPHQVAVERCGETGRNYILTKVCSRPHIPPDFWLAVCPLRRVGFLFPGDVFDNHGEDVLAEQLLAA